MKKTPYLLGLFLAIISFSTYSQIDPNTVPASGNVGLGTLFPEEKLHVVGNVLVDSNTLINGAIYVQGNSLLGPSVKILDTSMTINLPVDVQSISVANEANFANGIHTQGSVIAENLNLDSDHSDLERSFFLTIDEDGNISRTSINQLIFPGLDMDEAFPCHFLHDPSGSVTAPDPVPIWQYGPGKIYSDQECTSMKLGLNTDNPTHTLTVGGDGIATSFTTKNVLESQRKIRLYNKNIQKNVFEVSDDGTFYFQNQYKKLLQLESDGLLRTREIKVDVNSWPDYVFNDRYNLMPLDDLEVYIKSNGHLPNIPSENEMKQNGMNVAETNVFLMEKIEELTLYVIELNKEIEELKKEK